jgi:hypothetical protein
MRTRIDYVGPQGSTVPASIYVSADVVADLNICKGRRLKISPPESAEEMICRVEAVKMNVTCLDGQPANIVTVRPLSTLN